MGRKLQPFCMIHRRTDARRIGGIPYPPHELRTITLRMMKSTGIRLLAAAPLSIHTLGLAEPRFNLPEPVSPLTRDIYDLHTMTSLIALILMVIVTAIVIYSLVKFRKSTGYVADQNFHNSWFGRWSWVLVPLMVLGIDLTIAGRASGTLESLYDHPTPDMTIKITGSQWKWTYEYMDDGIRFTSNLDRDLTPQDAQYLREVDNPLVLPVDTNVRFLHTSSDVLHNWWVPSVAYKVDAVPGFINETRTRIEKEGVYRGQCAENCGTGHAFMPIVVKAVSKEAYAAWKNDQLSLIAAANAEASADKEWGMDELVARGKEVYEKTCVACHQVTGMGIPGVFPALNGSKVATGDVAKHLDTVVNGVAGTAMSAWKEQLNDLEIAAVITYERNSWDNHTGDVVQPAAVKALR